MTRCDLDHVLGRETNCPGASCAFWERGGCQIVGLRHDLRGNRDLAALLVRIRDELGVRAGHAFIPPELRG